MEYIEVFEEAEKKGHIVCLAKPMSEKAIAEIASALKFRFPKSFVEFLLQIGGGGLMEEVTFTEIWEGKLFKMQVGMVYAETIWAREKFALPKGYLVVFTNHEFSELGCVDCSKLDENGEGPVLRYSTWDRKITHVLGENFETFFLKTMNPYVKESHDETVARVRLEMGISPDDPVSSFEVMSQWFSQV